MSNKRIAVGLTGLILAAALFAWYLQHQQKVQRNGFIAECAESYRQAEMYSGVDARSYDARRIQCVKEYDAASD